METDHFVLDVSELSHQARSLSPTGCVDMYFFGWRLIVHGIQ